MLAFLERSSALLVCFLLGTANAWAQQLLCSSTRLTPPGVPVGYGVSITANGGIIAFSSSGDFTGSNLDGNHEIFLLDVASGVFTQVTNTAHTNNYRPALSSNGSTLVFDRVTPGQDVFVYDILSGSLQQVPDALANAGVSSDGQKVLVFSVANPTGQNADGSWDLFLYNRTASSFTQLTFTQDVAMTFNEARLSDNAMFASFQSSYPLVGPNGDGNSENYILNTSSGLVTRLTDISAPAMVERPRIDGSGRYVVFGSDKDFTGENPDNNWEIFLFDMAAAQLSQLTDTIGVYNSDAGTSKDGNRVTFVSTANYNGTNPDASYDLFVYDRLTGVVSPVFDSGANGYVQIHIEHDADGGNIAFVADSGNGAGEGIYVAKCRLPDNQEITVGGSNVAVTPEATLPDGSTAEVELMFEDVTGSGVTTVTASVQGPPPPSGFKLTNPPVYYEISTTATFTGSIRVCLSWAQGQIANEGDVKMFHYEAGQWGDITDTTSRDTVNNKVCGTTTSLSPFALMEVKYPFTGFLQPVDNLPTVNAVKAGAAVPVRFSLGGDRGLNIFASGYPKAQQMQCTTGEAIAVIEETTTAGGSTLSYDAATGVYTYVWQTQKSWANSCRELQVKLNDGEVYPARFTLRK